ncbi:hypothetical protein CCYA_CCYA11G3171 [Cyanidiococcus yangmingshanensis]|nr:hypothetical protein CCYA_CCYA11G3171 [Cyanidiococcus yangmingshanensis]
MPTKEYASLGVVTSRRACSIPRPWDRLTGLCRTRANNRVRLHCNYGGRARPGDPEPPESGKGPAGPSGSSARGGGRPEELPEEDRPPSLEEQSPYELTLSQQLLLQQYIAEIEQTSAEACREMCVALMSQMMMKENLIKELLGRDDIEFPSMPPVPGSEDEPPEGRPQR